MKTLRVITPTVTVTFGTHEPPNRIVYMYESGIRIYAGPCPGPDRIEIRLGVEVVEETMQALRWVMQSVENAVIRIDALDVVIGLRLAGSDDMIPLRVIRLVTP